MLTAFVRGASIMSLVIAAAISSIVASLRLVSGLGRTRMDNDLISRSALLKAMEEERQYLLARGQAGAEHIIVHHCLPIIDNAPAIDNAYQEGHIDGALETLEDKNISEDKKGYWEAPDPDYDRDGERIPIRVAICSECQKPNRLPVGRYCSECGSCNAKEE